MEPERWRRVADLFHAALAQPRDRRDAFLDDACSGDAALRAEVASLVARHQSGDTFLETPAAALDATEEPAEPELLGRRLGPYAVQRLIGRGGMGVVYLAEDTRLGRSVAIKALAPEYTKDAARRERLRREARAAAALSHPGIATVHALEEFDEGLFIVSEYVDGKTLRAELAQGPLPIVTLVDTAVAMASALAAAHRQGVVHRDLKPENVIRSRNGAVKILDFGLARVTHPSGARAPLSTQLTGDGVVVGTPAYMSPEQLRGNPVDARTDLFSFGVMLYELATGVHPFADHDTFTTIAHILESTPSALSERRPLVPWRLTQIVDRALHKRPEDRYETADELRADLEQLRRQLETATPEALAYGSAGALPATAARQSPLWWWRFHQAAAGVAVLALLVPLWLVRGWLPGLWAHGLFFPALAVALVASTLRLHLVFTAHYYRAEFPRQRARVGPWVTSMDTLFALLLGATAAVLVSANHNAVATLFLASAIALAISSLVIEPTTTRAAFRSQ